MFKFSSTFTSFAMSNIGWSSEFCLDTGKQTTKTTKKVDFLDEDKLKENIREFIKDRFLDEREKFLETLTKSKEGYYRYKNKKVYLKEKKGLLFVNPDNTYYSIEPEQDLFFLDGFKKDNIYLCLSLQELFICQKATNSKVYLADFTNYKSFAEQLAVRFHDKNIILLNYNPNSDRIEREGLSKENYLFAEADKFIHLPNVIILYPPEKELIFSWLDYHKKFKKACEKRICRVPKNPKLQFLGHDGDGVWVYSKHLEKPRKLKSSDKATDLQLIATDDYYKAKFSTTSAAQIIKKMHSLSRGRFYQEEKLRYAGVFLDKNLPIINTGKNLNRPPKERNNYVFSGNFPDVINSPIDKHAFSKLKLNFLDLLAVNDTREGYSIIAWTILSLFSKCIPMRFSLNLYGDTSAGKSLTIRQVVKPLQERFKFAIRSYMPGATFAGIKDDLREGISVLHFEEAEGKNFDPALQKIIRSSTYESGFIKQMGKGGSASKKTQTSFMSSACFNLLPEGYEEPDQNRTYAINYSTDRISAENREKIEMAIYGIDMPELGHQMFSHLYKNWRDFIAYYNDARIKLSLFGTMINGHKKNMYSQLYSFLKIIDVLGEKELVSYVEFLREKEDREVISYKANIIDSILRIQLADEDGFKRRTLRGIMEGVVNYSDDRFKHWQYWLAHARSHYKIFFKEIEGKAYLCVLKDDRFIIESLKRQGYQQKEAYSYIISLESQRGVLRKKIELLKNDFRVFVCIPVSKVCSRKKEQLWHNLAKDGRLNDLYY